MMKTFFKQMLNTCGILKSWNILKIIMTHVRIYECGNFYSMQTFILIHRHISLPNFTTHFIKVLTVFNIN